MGSALFTSMELPLPYKTRKSILLENKCEITHWFCRYLSVWSGIVYDPPCSATVASKEHDGWEKSKCEWSPTKDGVRPVPRVLVKDVFHCCQSTRTDLQQKHTATGCQTSLFNFKSSLVSKVQNVFFHCVPTGLFFFSSAACQKQFACVCVCVC